MSSLSAVLSACGVDVAHDLQQITLFKLEQGLGEMQVNQQAFMTSAMKQMETALIPSREYNDTAAQERHTEIKEELSQLRLAIDRRDIKVEYSSASQISVNRYDSASSRDQLYFYILLNALAELGQSVKQNSYKRR